MGSLDSSGKNCNESPKIFKRSTKKNTEETPWYSSFIKESKVDLNELREQNCNETLSSVRDMLKSSLNNKNSTYSNDIRKAVLDGKREIRNFGNDGPNIFEACKHRFKNGVYEHPITETPFSIVVNDSGNGYVASKIKW